MPMARCTDFSEAHELLCPPRPAARTAIASSSHDRATPARLVRVPLIRCRSAYRHLTDMMTACATRARVGLLHYITPLLLLAVVPPTAVAEVWVGYAGDGIGPLPDPTAVVKQKAASIWYEDLPTCYWDVLAKWHSVDTYTERKIIDFGLTQESGCNWHRTTGYRCKDGSSPKQKPWANDPGNLCTGPPQSRTVKPKKNAGPPRPCDVKVCNPINVGTGNKYQREQDYSGAGPFPLRFVRHYNSVDGIELRHIGEQWRHSYDRTVVSGASIVTLNRADGRVLEFEDIGGNWFGDPDVAGRLFRLTDGGGNPTGWEYRDANDSTETYDNDGKLLSITTRAGFTQSLSYDLSDRLIQVTGPFGRTLAFGFDPSGRIASMTDPAGAVYQYAYDAKGNLVSVTYPDATPGSQADNAFRFYHYEDPGHLSTLTGITDENRVRFATWAYDAQGRAVSGTHAGGAENASLTYNADGTTTLIDALGTTRRFGFDISHGHVRVADVTGGPCGVGCSAHFQDRTYDLNGYPASHTDFNGNVTTFV